MLIDSPKMRHAGPELLSLALMDSRNHFLHLLAQFENHRPQGSTALLAAQKLAGHVGWFQEWWIGRNMQRTRGEHCETGHARLASIEPNADRWWKTVQPENTGDSESGPPDMAACRDYLLGTLESTLELLEKIDRGTSQVAAREGPGVEDDALYFYRLALFHEDLQCEILAHQAQAMGLILDRPLMMAFTPPTLNLREPLLLPATTWLLGSRAGPGEGFAFDNEQPAHPVDVPAFEIDAHPVTWAQYVEFVDDGGYDREELWHADGWRWLRGLDDGDGRRAPRYVEQIGVASGAVMQVRFGQRMRMQSSQPAMHVTWWEADAWCRWAGRRLPFEVEWEVAAATATRRGFRWGDVWEWTASTFRPYPGFKAGPWSDYSLQGFEMHRVLRGASFATRARMKAVTFRQFRRPECDELFCGFRSCAF